MIYFTADLHLGHAKILDLAKRPFSSVEEMDETLIANWNAKVKGGDTVYVLGDLIVKCKDKDPETYLRRLKGKKILVLGNHDEGWLQRVDASKYFVRVERYVEQSIGGRMLTMCHYPMMEWRASRKDQDCKKLGYLIHGHVHGRDGRAYAPLFAMPHALNAGVDVNGFAPVTLEELVCNNANFREECKRKWAQEDEKSEHVHEMQLNAEPFERMVSGRKTMELRLWDDKRKRIRVGDEIVFRLRDDEERNVRVKVQSLHVFESFAALYGAVPPAVLGYLEGEPANSSDMDAFYAQEEQAKYGVVGIRFARI